LEQLYTQEQQTSQILNIAMSIAIFISCMGLYGLAAFTANQRTREIGITVSLQTIRAATANPVRSLKVE
jgi:hypothetical protein